MSPQPEAREVARTLGATSHAGWTESRACHGLRLGQLHRGGAGGPGVGRPTDAGHSWPGQGREPARGGGEGREEEQRGRREEREVGREGHGDKPPAQEASKDLTFKAGSTPEDFTLRTLFFFFFSFTKEPVLVDMEEPVWEQEPALPAPGLCRSPGSKVGWRPAGSASISISTTMGRKGLLSSHWGRRLGPDSAGCEKARGREPGVEARWKCSRGPEAGRCPSDRLTGPRAG